MLDQPNYLLIKARAMYLRLRRITQYRIKGHLKTLKCLIFSFKLFLVGYMVVLATSVTFEF